MSNESCIARAPDQSCTVRERSRWNRSTESWTSFARAPRCEWTASATTFRATRSNASTATASANASRMSVVARIRKASDFLTVPRSGVIAPPLVLDPELDRVILQEVVDLRGLLLVDAGVRAPDHALHVALPVGRVEPRIHRARERVALRALRRVDLVGLLLRRREPRGVDVVGAEVPRIRLVLRGLGGDEEADERASGDGEDLHQNAPPIPAW